MKQIIRCIRRAALKRQMYKRYGHHIRADFRGGRVFKVPDNPRRSGRTENRIIDLRAALGAQTSADGEVGEDACARPGSVKESQKEGSL